MEPITPKEPEQEQDEEMEEIEQLAEMAHQFLHRASAYQKHINARGLPPMMSRAVSLAFLNVQQGQLWLSQAAAELQIYRERASGEGNQAQPPEGTSEERTGEVD